MRRLTAIVASVLLVGEISTSAAAEDKSQNDESKNVESQILSLEELAVMRAGMTIEKTIQMPTMPSESALLLPAVQKAVDRLGFSINHDGQTELIIIIRPTIPSAD